MAQDLAYSFAGIIKSEKQEDGTLKVYGKATDDSVDSDLQICDEIWLRKAMPDWFTTGGNIREQHSNIAAGVATDYERKEDGHYITALVVDPTSVKKVEAGVLKGFSIGIRAPRVIRDTKALGGRIVDGQIIEVSLVDRPANPNAKLMLAKAAESGELMAVEQTDIPTPAEVFSRKSDEAEVAVEVEAEIEAEATEEATEAPVEAAEVAPVEEATEAPAEGSEIIEAAKSLLATLNKFDQAGYDAAVNAIADLIIVEAGEMKQGMDERESIKELLRAAKHLAEWYEGEVEAGEVAGVEPELETEDLYLSATADKMCDKCNKSDGECDCEAEKSAAPELTVDAGTEEALIAKAVEGAKAAISAEVASLKAAFEAEVAKSAKLESELSIAKAAAVSGGPKRSIVKSANPEKANELLVKAAEFARKADATSDQLLAEGYREISEDYKIKAAKAARKES